MPKASTSRGRARTQMRKYPSRDSSRYQGSAFGLVSSQGSQWLQKRTFWGAGVEWKCQESTSHTHRIYRSNTWLSLKKCLFQRYRSLAQILRNRRDHPHLGQSKRKHLPWKDGSQYWWRSSSTCWSCRSWALVWPMQNCSRSASASVARALCSGSLRWVFLLRLF